MKILLSQQLVAHAISAKSTIPISKTLFETGPRLCYEKYSLELPPATCYTQDGARIFVIQ